MPTRFQRSSNEYVRAAVFATEAGVAVVPTGDVVKMAVVAAGAVPVTGDFTTGSWETDTSYSPTRYWARCLVDFTTLAASTYPAIFDVYLKITDAPEVPVVLSGSIEVY